jgi:hypothetical protein
MFQKPYGGTHTYSTVILPAYLFPLRKKVDLNMHRTLRNVSGLDADENS